jgi:Uma2 family endonuclease
MITDINELDLNKTYSYADYLTWQFQDKLELIKGKIFKMSPAPSTNHQRISMELAGILYNFFKPHQCNLLALHQKERQIGRFA